MSSVSVLYGLYCGLILCWSGDGGNKFTLFVYEYWSMCTVAVEIFAGMVAWRSTRRCGDTRSGYSLFCWSILLYGIWLMVGFGRLFMLYMHRTYVSYGAVTIMLVYRWCSSLNRAFLWALEPVEANVNWIAVEGNGYSVPVSLVRPEKWNYYWEYSKTSFCVPILPKDIGARIEISFVMLAVDSVCRTV